MKLAQRAQRAGFAAAMAAVVGGSGFAVGAATTSQPIASRPPAATAAGSATPAGYAALVRQVLPSVVLIRTPDGLGSGVILDTQGNIVTNAHLAGNATRFQVQLAGDPSPRSAHLVGSYRS